MKKVSYFTVLPSVTQQCRKAPGGRAMAFQIWTHHGGPGSLELLSLLLPGKIHLSQFQNPQFDIKIIVGINLLWGRINLLTYPFVHSASG